MQFINGWTKEKVRSHLEENFKGKSVFFDDEFESHNCRYRIGDNKCVVGCFIPDNKYDKSMENMSADSIIEDFDLNPFMPLNKTDMNLWQNVHDDLCSKDPAEKQLNDLMNYLD